MSSNILLQCLLGIQGQNFAMIAADQTATQSVFVLKNDENKIHQVSENMLMGVNGDAADITQFVQFVAKNIHLYKMRNNYQLSTKASVHFTRKNLAEGLRGGNPYVVNFLIAGYDQDDGGQLYFMDYLCSCVKVPFATHGFGGMLSMGILDKYYKPTLSEAEAYDLLKTCVKEVQTRLFVNLPNFQVTSVGLNGIDEWPVINSGSLVA